VRERVWAELLNTLRSMSLLYWLTIAFGLLLSLLYFVYDCLIRPVYK
jgi:hypothetical protein